MWSLINQRKNFKNISFLSCQVYCWTCQMISQGLSGFLLGLGGGGNNLERSFCMNPLFLPAFIFRKESNTMSHISPPTVNRNSLWERWAFDGMNELHFVPAPLQAETRACTTIPMNLPRTCDIDLDTHLKKSLCPLLYMLRFSNSLQTLPPPRQQVRPARQQPALWAQGSNHFPSAVLAPCCNYLPRRGMQRCKAL